METLFARTIQDAFHASAILFSVVGSSFVSVCRGDVVESRTNAPMATERASTVTLEALSVLGVSCPGAVIPIGSEDDDPTAYFKHISRLRSEKYSSKCLSKVESVALMDVCGVSKPIGLSLEEPRVGACTTRAGVDPFARVRLALLLVAGLEAWETGKVTKEAFTAEVKFSDESDSSGTRGSDAEAAARYAFVLDVLREAKSDFPDDRRLDAWTAGSRLEYRRWSAMTPTESEWLNLVEFGRDSIFGLFNALVLTRYIPRPTLAAEELDRLVDEFVMRRPCDGSSPANGCRAKSAYFTGYSSRLLLMENLLDRSVHAASLGQTGPMKQAAGTALGVGSSFFTPSDLGDLVRWTYGDVVLGRMAFAGSLLAAGGAQGAPRAALRQARARESYSCGACHGAPP